MRALSAFGFLFLCTSLSAAQETTGDIRGRVTFDGQPVVGAKVAASADGAAGERRSSSKSDGVFELRLLPPGSYTVHIAALGFKPMIVENVVVRLGQTTGLDDFILARAATQLDEIKIVGKSVGVDPTRTTIGATLEAQDYSALPSERDYKSLITVLPHINKSYHGDPANSGGSTGLENMYFIDGVNITAPLNAATGTSLPYNFIRAVEVRTGGYEAQYGKALGAIVNAVTYAGSNDFDANVFGFMTHDRLTSQPRAQPSIREARSFSYDVGARAGGRIIRDRLWYAAAYNPRISETDRIVGELGTFTDSRTAHVFAGKLTFEQAENVNVELSVFGDPTTQKSVSIPDFIGSLTPKNVDPYLNKAEGGGVTVALRSSVSLSSSVLLEAAFSNSTFRDNILPRTAAAADGALADYTAGTLEGGPVFESRNQQARFSATLKATASIGRHTATTGAEYEVNRDSFFFETPGAGFIEKFDDATYVAGYQFVNGKVRARIPTFYLQDSWRVSDRFTLNPGFRWSGEYLNGTSGKTAQRFPHEWQPRIGFSWQPGVDRKQRVFGSYGRFYQQIPLNIGALYYIDFTGFVRVYNADPRGSGSALLDSIDFSTKESDYAHSIKDASVENFDELALGYEKLIHSTSRLTLRGMRRNLRSSFQQGIDPSGKFVVGSAGRGPLSFLPKPVRTYSALEASFDGVTARMSYRLSYVLSRTYGNYTGLYASDVYIANPGNNPSLATVDHRINTEGLLPNDRTHVVKLTTSYRLGGGFSAGGIGSWMSGTPLSETANKTWYPVFLSPRGQAGRTPNLWDVSLRLVHASSPGRRATVRVIGDVLNLGNPQRAVRRDMTRYRMVDPQGLPGLLNTNFLKATAFQPPMMVRIGAEIGRVR